MSDAVAPLRTDAKVVMGAFVASGLLHLARPRTFEPLMPRWVPAHRQVIVWSGVAELACAAGLAVPATRRTAGLASAAVLLAVYPGNVKMAVDATRTTNDWYKAATFARLPLQLPMIRAALRAGR